jgi:hypothetical protein
MVATTANVPKMAYYQCTPNPSTHSVEKLCLETSLLVASANSLDDLSADFSISCVTLLESSTRKTQELWDKVLSLDHIWTYVDHSRNASFPSSPGCCNGGSGTRSMLSQVFGLLPSNSVAQHSWLASFDHLNV